MRYSFASPSMLRRPTFRNRRRFWNIGFYSRFPLSSRGSLGFVPARDEGFLRPHVLGRIHSTALGFVLPALCGLSAARSSAAASAIGSRAKVVVFEGTIVAIVVLKVVIVILRSSSSSNGSGCHLGRLNFCVRLV